MWENQLGVAESAETLLDSEASGLVELTPTNPQVDTLRRHGVPTPPSSDSEVPYGLHGTRGNPYSIPSSPDSPTHDQDLYR